MGTIAFIPARGGSKSIKSKNIKLLGGKPLISWVLIELEQAKKVDKVVVATDDDEIANIVLGLGLSKISVFRRSNENASDSASTESVMLEYLDNERISQDDNFMLAQATSPFTKSQDFDTAISLLEKENFDSIISCARIRRFFWNQDGSPINYDYSARPRRQDFNGTLIENGAIYVSSVARIISSKNRISGNIGIYEMPEHTSLELDEPHDWDIAEKLFSFEINDNRKEIKLVLSDVDGVLTDAGMYYSESGDEQKKFSTYDGLGFRMLQEAGIKVGILTSENTNLNQRRADKLKLDYVFQGASNKLEIVKNLCSELKFDLQNVAYIGDDINDLELLREVGLAACPANARNEIKSISSIYQLTTKGGDGALREFVDLIIGVKV